MNLHLILWWLVIYSFLGWCVEVIYATANYGKFINRGFLSGAYCPIYGFGAVLVLWLTEPFADGLIIPFIISILLTSGIELLVGITMKKIFNQRWWDYSDTPFNLYGYICLRFSLLWGLACLFVIKIIHPIVNRTALKFTNQLGLIVLGVILVAILIDLIATVNQMLKLRKQLLLIDDIDRRILSFSDSLGEKISTVSQTTINELGELRKLHDEVMLKINRYSRRLTKAFPDVKLTQLLNKSIDLKNNIKRKAKK